MVHELRIETEIFGQSKTVRIVFAVLTEFLTLKQNEQTKISTAERKKKPKFSPIESTFCPPNVTHRDRHLIRLCKQPFGTLIPQLPPDQILH